MANAIYPKFKETILQGGIDMSTADIRSILIDLTDYTYSSTHQFLSSVPAGAREEVSAAMTTKTFTDGVFDADDVTFSGTAGDDVDAIIIYRHTGSDATADLIAYIDTGITGSPATLGGDVTIRWDSGANKIFAL